MFSKDSTIRTALVSLAASAAVVALYHKGYVSRHYVDQNNATKLSQSIEPVLWDIIRQNPDAFFKVMNEAAQAQQEKTKGELEKSATQAKDQLLSMGLKMGSQKADAVKFVAFIDLMDPVSQEFQKVAFRTMNEKNDISFQMIPLAINGLNSEVMARFVLAANTQKDGNIVQFLETFLDRMSQMTRAKLLDTAKAAGFDVAQIEKNEADKKVEEALTANMKIAEELKVQGTPTVYVVHRDGKMTLVPPMDVGGFLELAQVIRSKSGSQDDKKDPQQENSPIVIKNEKPTSTEKTEPVATQPAQPESSTAAEVKEPSQDKED